MKTLAAALAIAVVLAPFDASADPLSVFQPGGVRAVSVTPADLRAFRALPALERFGTVDGAAVSVRGASSRGDAAAKAGYALRLPATLDGRAGEGARYQVTTAARATFTFSAAKAAAWAREHDVPLAPLPDGLDGSAYTVVLAPLTVATFGAPPRGRRAVARAPFVAVVQAPLPVVRANGVPLATLARWFSEQPGMPAGLAAQVRAIGDPSQTIPIPVAFDRQSAADVAVDGVRGLAIGDETGLGSAVVWTKGGTLYAVGGTLTQSGALELANALR